MSKAIAVIPSLSQADKRYLEEREKQVHTYHKASIAAAKALHEIKNYKDGTLWREHGTFEIFCRVKFGYVRSRTSQLLGSGEVIHEIEAQSSGRETTQKDYMPTSESHLWPLQKLPLERRAECWRAVVAAPNKPRELSAKLVRREVAKFAKEQGLSLAGKKAKRRMTEKRRAASALGRLKAAVAELPDPDRFKALLEQFKEMIG